MAETQSGKAELGVLLFNLGGPETLADVRPFLFNLFSDPDIIRIKIARCDAPSPGSSLH